MFYRINIIVEVDPDSNFLEADQTTNREVLLDMFSTLVYDIDDIKLEEIEVEDE